jgi:CNT family concentrative nucleoside transporter
MSTHPTTTMPHDTEAGPTTGADMPKLEKRASPGSPAETYDEKAAVEVARDEAEVAEHKAHKRTLYARFRPLILGATAALILGWWVSATVLKATRHRWIVQSLFAWSFLFIIAFRFIPNSVVTRPVEAVWEPIVSRPFFKLPYKSRLGLGVLALLAVVFGSAYGFALTNVCSPLISSFHALF